MDPTTNSQTTKHDFYTFFITSDCFSQLVVGSDDQDKSCEIVLCIKKNFNYNFKNGLNL